MRRSSEKSLIPNEVREAFKRAAELILPFKCAVCGGVADTDDRFGNYETLYRAIYGMESELHICGKCLSMTNTVDEDNRWFLCLSNPVENDPCPGLALYMPFPYKGFFEKAVPSMKFHSHPELAQFAGILLGGLMKKDNIGADLIVPVPLAPSRLKERGYNQAGLIASEASKICGIPYAGDVLVRVRETERQTEIEDNTLRSMNVHGAFKVDPSFDVEGLDVLVLDDVATTGNTLHEAACALYEAGASKVLCCAVSGNRAVLNAESL